MIRDRRNRIFRMNQSHYFIDVLARFNMIIDKYKNTKLLINKYETLRSVELNDKRINQKNYQHAIENIMYATIYIRSNIAFAVEKFNQYFNNFAKHHERTLKHFVM